MCSARVVFVCVLAVLLVPHVAPAELTAEHFNYGPDAMPLYLLDGGVNWGGPWLGYESQSAAYDPTAGLSYGLPCYSPYCAYPNSSQGGAVHQSYRGSPRAFPEELAGCVWVSVLVQLGPNDSSRYVVVSNNSLSFGFGFTSACSLYVSFSGYATENSASEYSPYETHLVLAKLELNHNEFGHDRLSIWGDPDNTCSGEAGLGDPEAMVDGYDAASMWGILMLEVGNGSIADMIRVSHGTGACMEEALPCESPVPVESESWSRIKFIYR